MHMPEEEAFNVFCILMRDFGLRSLFRPTMSGLTLRLHQFECLVADVYPELHAHFTDMMIPTSSYASQWFLTLFGSALPLPCVERFVHYPTDYFHEIQGSCWGATSTFFTINDLPVASYRIHAVVRNSDVMTSLYKGCLTFLSWTAPNTACCSFLGAV